MTQDVRSDPGGLVPGEQLAGYQIQEQIGRGGMAVVYRARDLRLGRPVALKVLAPHLGEDEAFRQRFIRESRAAAGADHPHIIPVFEAGEADGVLFIAMRYVDHGDVRLLIDTEGWLNAARAAAITLQIAAALDTAHGHGLVHRDVKPGNILLARASSGADHAYLSDFGLSKHSLTPSTLTSTGQFLGTLDYVAPEQIQGHPVDGRADQYALACTVVEMLTGAPPFQRDDSVALMWAQLESEPPRVTQRRPELPSAVDEVIAAGLAKSPASRYSSCQDFALALRAACAAAGRPRTSAAPVRGTIAAVRPTAYDLEPPAGHRREPAGSASAAPQPAARTEPRMWSAQPDTRPAAVRRRRSHRAQNFVVSAILVLACLGGAAGIGYALSHHHHGAFPPAAGGRPAALAGQANPARVVREYFAAINHHRWLVAYRLGHRSDSLAHFVAGFAGTADDVVTIDKVTGDVVTASLRAVQDNGSVKLYQGTYTVVDGVIGSSDIHQVS